VRQTKESEIQKVKFQKAISAEPTDGLLLAILLPNQQRLTRKFAVDWKGQVVIDWVETVYGIEKELILRQSIGEVLNPLKTLEEQKISSRTLFNLLLK
jgi:hypothetical protein